MTIAVRKNLVSSSKYSLKCPYPMDAQYITFHNTYNDASADAEVRYMIGNEHAVSFHFAVDDKEIVQGIPTNRNAYHCGDGSKGTGNRKSIGVEVCYSKSGGDRYKKAEENAIQFIAQMLHDRGWGVDRVKPHQHWSGKYCPHRVLADARWNSVVSRIQKALSALNGGKATTVTIAPATEKGYLEKGDKGTAVKELQQLLIDAGYKIDADGIFGDATLTAVGDFQKRNGLATDGLAGKETIAKLKAVTEVQTVKMDDSVYGIVEVLVDNLNLRKEASFDSEVVGTTDTGDSWKAYGIKNGLYVLGGAYISSSSAYVKFTPNSNYGKPQMIRVLADKLYTYNSADWNDKGIQVSKGEVFTIAKELTVNGSKMYQLKSGLYITASPKYVEIV